MGQKSLLVVALSILLGSILPGLAQGQDTESQTVLQLSKSQRSELTKWMSADAKWQKWYKTWGNKARVKIRRRPEPPVWLAPVCEETPYAKEELLVRGCVLLRETKADPAASKIRQTIESERKQKEAPTKSRFMEKVHFGFVWPITDSSMYRYGALFETHYQIFNLDRVEVNLPGLMVLSLPGLYGKRVISFGSDVSLSFRLKEFRVPGVKQKYLLHFNFANSLAYGNAGNLGYNAKVTMAGLSFTLKD